jgi:peptidoglycan/xylan/chitin deacetylase (PgdA/CDA1 family)
MLRKLKLYLSIFIFASSGANSTSLDDVVDLSGIVSSSEYSAETHSSTDTDTDTDRSIFATRKVSGMEIIILNRESREPAKRKRREEIKEKRGAVDVEISLKDVISRIVDDQRQEKEVERKEISLKKDVNSSKEGVDHNSSASILNALVADRFLDVDYRNIATKLKKYLYQINPNKILYLTFDDGPLKGTTNVLKILQDEQIEATMFCVGKHAVRKWELFEKEKSMSNLLIANHTYSHANGRYRRFYQDMYGVLSDIEHGQLVVGGKKFLRLAGRNVWRLPKVSRNDYGLARGQRAIEIQDYNALYREGFFIIGWDIEWGFNHRTGMPSSSAQSLASRIESLYKSGDLAKKGKVVLLTHDFMFKSENSANELRSFIKIMRQNGWKFKKIDHYVATQPEPLKYVKYYKSKSGRKLLAMMRRDKVSNGTTGTIKKDEDRSSNIIIDETRAKRSSDLDFNNALIKKVKYILKMGIDPNIRDKHGRLALNTAIEANNMRIVKKLIKYGARLNARDRWGNTPISVARKYNRKRISRYLRRFMIAQNRVVKRHRVAKQRRDVSKVKKKRDALSILRVNPL